MGILGELEVVVSTSLDSVCSGGPERWSEVLQVSVWQACSGPRHSQDLQGRWPSLRLGEERVGSPHIDQGARPTQRAFMQTHSGLFHRFLRLFIARAVLSPVSTLSLSQALPGLGSPRCSPSSSASSRGDKHEPWKADCARPLPALGSDSLFLCIQCHQMCL